MAYDNEQYLHREWLGLLQPEGLVVSPPALADKQAFVDKSSALRLQPVLQGLVKQELIQGKEQTPQTYVPEFLPFAEQVLEWDAADVVAEADLPASLEVNLSDYGEVLRPQYGVEDPDSEGYLLLVKVVPLGRDLDGEDPNAGSQGGSGGWKASPQQKFERLLKGVNVPIGILWNGVALRLVYAPSGESSGHITFPIEAMTEVPGRLILGALEMLLGADRLWNAPTDRTLPKLLAASRDYQANVSTQLAEQVLDALWELLRGFQAAEAQRDDGQGHQNGGLRRLAEEKPQHVYGGLLTTLMRLVFLLYAEDQGLMPDDEVYQGNYSVAGLYEKLRDDDGAFHDTMDQRYGAWAWLLSLFRLVYDGGGSYEAYLPARHGQLFDPKEFPFLEGCFASGSPRPELGEGLGERAAERVEIPRIADGVIYRMLQKLLILDGERLSYRALDVEQIGSVYEAIMGYEVEIAKAQSIAVKPKDVVINLEDLLAQKPKDRAKWLKEAGELKLSGKGATALKEAETVPELLAALERRVSERTLQVLMPGALYLQPGEERRRTGSHYTPRKLTQPIVETTLRPIFERLGEQPTAEQILELKVCDLAMGSAAFLVEACRQLAAKLVAVWDYHGMPEDVPEAVEPLLYARRLVAQRCLYGVDKNPFAVNLAKLSLWLVTLARDLPFTFVDHSLKCGDSLVGLTRKEIVAFGRDPVQDLPLMKYGQEQILAATVLRSQIQSGDTLSDGDADLKYRQWRDAEAKLGLVRMQGDVAIAATFDGFGKSKKDRELLVAEYSQVVRSQPERMVAIAGQLREREKPVVPFSWEVEFPEVFDRENGGFDAIVGNPPFLKGSFISSFFGEDYRYFLPSTYPESHGNSDLVAYFFRRAFELIRVKGGLGLISTNTIAQGDTRTTSLQWICRNKGVIFGTQKRMKWPGQAAVSISTVHIFKGQYGGVKNIGNRSVPFISAFLFHMGSHSNPKDLIANSNKSFMGVYALGMGFTFDDDNPEASPLEEMKNIIKENSRNGERIFPYIGGDEMLSHPEQRHRRYIINFDQMSCEEISSWPTLVKILEVKVKSQRAKQKDKRLREKWWQYKRPCPDLYEAIDGLDRVLMHPNLSTHLAFAFVPSDTVIAAPHIAFAFSNYSSFCILQSCIHEIWVRFFGSSLEDRLRYTHTDCFANFPFPENWETDPTLETIGKDYYDYRAALMIRNNQGLTDTYNRFHDPQETDPEIHHLRHLHSQMDQAVLTAYGWTNLETDDQGLIPCGFALDYLDIDETNLPPDVQDRIATGNLHWPDPAQAAAFDNQIQSSQKRRKKLPWRYRWPEAIHDEILARLLDLNQKRYEEEVRGGLHAKKKTGKAKAKAKKNAKAKPPPRKKQLNLIPPATEQLDLLD